MGKRIICIEMELYKGVFWYDPQREMLITRKVACDEYGIALEAVEYSSKSGGNFNHKEEWSKFPRNITNRHPYNYYPRGRVEIKNNKATVYINPILNTPKLIELIELEFNIFGKHIPIRISNDGSAHYNFLLSYQT